MADSTIEIRSQRLGQEGACFVSPQASENGGIPSTQSRPIRLDSASESTQSLSPDAIVQRIADVRHHLEMCIENLRTIESTILATDAVSQQAVAGVSPLTIRTIAGCLSELLKLEWTQPHRQYCPDLCKLLDCPQQPVLRQAILHAIDVIETTKFRFKSKELKRLREDLQTLLENSLEFSPSVDG